MDLLIALIVLSISLLITYEITEGNRRRYAKKIVRNCKTHRNYDDISYTIARRILQRHI